MVNNKVYFEEINGKKIFCIFSEPDEPTRKIIIMSHGFRGSSIGPARQFVDFAQLLLKEGYSVLRFDQPNCGNSEGDFLNSSFKEWVATIVYFSKKYLELSYQVALLGQSMGASATVVATHNPAIAGKIPCILLWVPDPKSNIEEMIGKVYEEGGQKYDGRFWQEAKDANFFECLNSYSGAIHLVYGETDKYVDHDLKNKTINIVEGKSQPVMILKGQDHSPWDYDLAQQVYQEEIKILHDYFK